MDANKACIYCTAIKSQVFQIYSRITADVCEVMGFVNCISCLWTAAAHDVPSITSQQAKHECMWPNQIISHYKFWIISNHRSCEQKDHFGGGGEGMGTNLTLATRTSVSSALLQCIIPLVNFNIVLISTCTCMSRELLLLFTLHFQGFVFLGKTTPAMRWDC